MANVKLEFCGAAKTVDPRKRPLVIIGQVKNLKRLDWDEMRPRLEPRVTDEVWFAAVNMLNPSPTDSVHLFLNSAVVCALPSRMSRHNAPSASLYAPRLLRSNLPGAPDQCVTVVCEREDVFPLGCAVARAFPLFSRRTGGSRSSYNEPCHVTVEFILVDQSNQPLEAEALECLTTMAESIRLAARIVDTPCNEMNTENFLDELKAVGDELDIIPTVVRGEELNKKGFGGIYGVGRAASHPPMLAVLSHSPPGATQTIAWVGKGIVYDTGGLSIKGKTVMPGMKRDCGGAAAILGAFRAAVKRGFRDNLHAVFCLAENAVGPNATRPDDIHQLYSGK